MKKIISSVLLFAILAVAALALVSCAPAKDPAKAEAALKEAGYEVSNLTVDGVGMVSGMKVEDDTIKTVTIQYYADKDAANEAYDELKEEWDEVKDDEDYKDYEIGKSGTMVWAGHKDAIKAAR
ncbi:MAG: hypothetical protein IJX38_05540 [Clostridia bacterium]|nr:hypothetical protein [Clostridia bacterium]